MVVIREVINKKGLNFENQRRVIILRDKLLPNGKRLSFNKIAMRVRNYEGNPSCEDVVRRVYKRFSRKRGRVRYNYARCGRKRWKMTKEVGAFIIRTLLRKRKKVVVTATTLQADLYKEMKVKVSTSAVRKHLFSKGYRWRPRAQKRKYDKDARAGRDSFGKRYQHMSHEAINGHVALAMDGVVITVPPTDPVDRSNYCWHGESHMYRKADEAASPDLAGDDPYADQVPASRLIPLWGAISSAGFQEITYHKHRKLTAGEWVDVLKSGALLTAIRKLQPGRHQGPRRLLCDNETFLEAKKSRPYYRKKGITLLHIPAKSPDFNPIESFWGWLRRELRRRDLEDLCAKRAPLGKTAYKRRLKNILQSRRAQEAAKAKFRGFKGVCREVVKKKGAASRQ